MSYIGNNLDSDIQVNKYQYTATQDQTTFACTYDRAVDIYVNGLKLAKDDFTAEDGVQVVLGTGLNAGDIVDINAYFDVTYGGYDDNQIDTLLAAKADKATTLAGYGIGDAYTKAETDAKIVELASTSDLAGTFGRLSSPLLDLPLQNSLSMKAGVGSVTFERASTATYIDRYGVLQYADVDEPRFEKDGLLIEGASTNIQGYSSNFTHWVLRSSSNTIKTENATISPDGTTNAVKVECYGDAYGYITDYTLSQITSGNTYTAYAYVKNGDAEKGHLSVYDTINGAINGDVRYTFSDSSQTVSNTAGLTSITALEPVYLADGWIRIGFTFVPSVNSSTLRMQLHANSTTTTANKYTYWFGAQLEELPFATSYIPTTDSAVTRSSDICYLDNIGNVPQTNTGNPQMTVSVESDLLGLVGSTGSRILVSHYSTSANYWHVRRYSVDGRSGIISEDGNNITSHVILDNDVISNYKHNAFVFNGADALIYTNGSMLYSHTMTTDILTGNLLNRNIYIGSIAGVSSHHYGHIKNFKIFDKALTATEVSLLSGGIN